jgi:UDP-N-acetylmuramate dehydrogenase
VAALAEGKVRLADLTTLRLGGPAARVLATYTTDALVDAVRRADEAGEPVLLVGGGSNLLVADEGWPGVVLLVRTAGINWEVHGDLVALNIVAGQLWDDVVATSVRNGWSGLAAMSGIPGLTGATPVQNVGAYGSEVADSIVGLRVLDRRTGEVERWEPERCRFGFRTSAFKQTDRYVVLEVGFELRRTPGTEPVRYLELARRLGIEPGAAAPCGRVRDVVLELRRSKGMVVDADDHDTWSVGSFFVNPFVARALAPAQCPQWTVDGLEDQVKLSAAWLIERAGFTRGYGHGRVSVSTKHTLALTNRGSATAAELLSLAYEIRDGVAARFGIRLRPEARLAGIDWV